MNDLPPHSPECESAVLSLIMVMPDAIRRVAPVLHPNDFYAKINATLYDACLQVYNAGETVDTVRVATWLKDNGRLGAVGGAAGLTEVLNSAPNTANLMAYVKTVKDTARIRNLMRTCEDIIIEANGTHGDHLDFIARSRSKLNEVTRIAQYDSLTSNLEALKDLFRRIQMGAKGEVSGIRTHLSVYDKLTLGLHPGQLTIIGARPGQGKSALLLQIGTNVAKDGIGVLIFSLEMSTAELLERQLAYLARVDATLIRMGRLTPTQWTNITAAADVVSKLPIYINDRSDITINNIREIALGAIDKAFINKTPIGLIEVDYLQRVHIPIEKNRQRREQVDEVARGLKELSKETGVPIIAAAQLNRPPTTNPNARPTLESLREAGGIENEGDVVGLIHHPSAAKTGVPLTEAELIIAKSRHGRTGTIPLIWEPEYTCFSDAPDFMGE